MGHFRPGDVPLLFPQVEACTGLVSWSFGRSANSVSKICIPPLSMPHTPVLRKHGPPGAVRANDHEAQRLTQAILQYPCRVVRSNQAARNDGEVASGRGGCWHAQICQGGHDPSGQGSFLASPTWRMPQSQRGSRPHRGKSTSDISGLAARIFTLLYRFLSSKARTPAADAS